MKPPPIQKDTRDFDFGIVEQRPVVSPRVRTKSSKNFNIKPLVILAGTCAVGIVSGLVAKDKLFPSNTERLAGAFMSAPLAIQESSKVLNAGLLISSATYETTVTKPYSNYDVMGGRLFVGIKNRSGEVKSSCVVFLREMREGRPLPDQEAEEFVQFKGGMNINEMLEVKLLPINFKLSHWDNKVEVSLDKKRWVPATFTEQFMEDIAKQKELNEQRELRQQNQDFDWSQVATPREEMQSNFEEFLNQPIPNTR